MKAPLAILLLLCLGAGLPSLPTAPKRFKPVHGPTKGDGAAQLIAKAPRATVAPSIRLDWNFDGSAEAIVFNVRCLKGPLAAPDPSWPIVATVTSIACVLALDKTAGMVWFSVTASNTLSGLESGFAGQ